MHRQLKGDFSLFGKWILPQAEEAPSNNQLPLQPILIQEPNNSEGPNSQPNQSLILIGQLEPSFVTENQNQQPVAQNKYDEMELTMEYLFQSYPADSSQGIVPKSVPQPDTSQLTQECNGECKTSQFKRISSRMKRSHHQLCILSIFNQMPTQSKIQS